MVTTYTSHFLDLNGTDLVPLLGLLSRFLGGGQLGLSVPQLELQSRQIVLQEVHLGLQIFPLRFLSEGGRSFQVDQEESFLDYAFQNSPNLACRQGDSGSYTPFPPSGGWPKGRRKPLGFSGDRLLSSETGGGLEGRKRSFRFLGEFRINTEAGQEHTDGENKRNHRKTIDLLSKQSEEEPRVI